MPDDAAPNDVSARPDPDSPPWGLSLEDIRVHAWVAIDPDTGDWIADCKHIVPPASIAPDGGEPKCMDCVLARGSRVATAREARSKQVHAQTLRDLAADAEAGDSAGPDIDTDHPQDGAGTGLPAGLLQRIKQRYAARREL